MILSLRAKGRDESSGISLFGKVPAQTDFVRINHGYPASLELDGWLQRNLEELILAGKRFTGLPIRFLFAPEHIPQVLIGILAPSQDKAGRSFPITLFGALEVGLAARRLPLVPVAYATYMAEIEALVADLPNLDYAQLKERVGAITLPGEEVFVDSEKTNQSRFEQTNANEVFDRLFGGSKEGGLQFALQTLLDVIEDVHNPSPKKAAVLECQAERDIDLWLWLEMIRRKLGWSDRSPSVFWIGSPENRLLISPRFPPVRLLRDIAKTEHINSCIRSLKSDDSSRPPETRNNLVERLRQLTDASTLNDLISILL